GALEQEPGPGADQAFHLALADRALRERLRGHGLEFFEFVPALEAFVFVRRHDRFRLSIGYPASARPMRLSATVRSSDEAANDRRMQSSSPNAAPGTTATPA